MFSFNLSFCLMLAAIHVCLYQCFVSAEHCSRKKWILGPVDVFECPFANFSKNHEFCCGTILQRTCCTLQEKRLDEDRYTSTSRAILSVIVTGITLIFIGFTVGWIYSCYVITHTPEELPEIDANGQPYNLNQENRNERSFLLTIVGRYLNFTGFDYNRSVQTNPIFAISPLNDKPPPYSSLFVCDRSCSTSGCESLAESAKSGLPTSWNESQSRPGHSIRVDSHFITNELPPPTYTNAIRLCDIRN